MTGEVQKAGLTVGRAIINLSGTYQTSGPTTALNLKVNGDNVSIDELEAFLPALGVHLPPGSQFKGGTLTTALTVSGSSANPVISGPVRLDNTQLAGFDLGAKLQTVAQLTGGKLGSATGSGTNIRSLSMNIREAGGDLQTDNIALDVAGVGTATGAGTVSEAGALNYNVVLKLTGLTGGSWEVPPLRPAPEEATRSAGRARGHGPHRRRRGSRRPGFDGGLAAPLKNGIPVAIGGTTSNPTFTPNLGGVASGVGAIGGKGLVNGKTKQNREPSQSSGQCTGRIVETPIELLERKDLHERKSSSVSTSGTFSVRPRMASLLVVAASPSGPVGLIQESTAAGKIIMETAGTAQTPLLKALSEDVMQTMSMPRPPAGATAEKVQDAAAEITISALLSTKATPEEASEVKEWLAKIAQATAEAAKEGGFLGFGGTSVSDKEEAALTTLHAALGLGAA